MKLARFSPAGLHLTLRNMSARAEQDIILNKPWGLGVAEDASRALRQASGALAGPQTRNKALRTLGLMMSPAERPGYIEAIIRLRQAIVSISLDSENHVASVDVARNRLHEVTVMYPEDDRERAARALVNLDRLVAAGLTVVNYQALWQTS